MQHMHKQEQPHLHQHQHKRQQPCEQEHKQTKLSTHWRSRMTAAVAPQIPSCQQYSVSHLAAGSSKMCVAHSASLRRWCSPTRLLTAVSPTGDTPPFFIREREPWSRTSYSGHLDLICKQKVLNGALMEVHLKLSRLNTILGYTNASVSNTLGDGA